MNKTTRKKFIRMFFGYIRNMKKGEEEKTAIRITQDIKIYTMEKDEEIERFSKRIVHLKILSKHIIQKYRDKELCDQDIEDFNNDLVKGETEIWKSAHMKNETENMENS